jgi:hypothetical protein
VLNLAAIVSLSPVLLLSMRALMIAFRVRSELEAVRSVRWASVSLGMTSAVALCAMLLVLLDQHDAPTASALRTGARAALNSCGPPGAVSAALLYLSADLLRGIRRAQG